MAESVFDGWRGHDHPRMAQEIEQRVVDLISRSDESEVATLAELRRAVLAMEFKQFLHDPIANDTPEKRIKILYRVISDMVHNGHLKAAGIKLSADETDVYLTVTSKSNALKYPRALHHFEPFASSWTIQ